MAAMWKPEAFSNFCTRSSRSPRIDLSSVWIGGEFLVQVLLGHHIATNRSDFGLRRHRGFDVGDIFFDAGDVVGDRGEAAFDSFENRFEGRYFVSQLSRCHMRKYSTRARENEEPQERWRAFLGFYDRAWGRIGDLCGPVTSTNLFPFRCSGELKIRNEGSGRRLRGGHFRVPDRGIRKPHAFRRHGM